MRKNIEEFTNSSGETFIQGNYSCRARNECPLYKLLHNFTAFYLILQQTEALIAWKERAAESTQGFFYMLPVSRIKGDWISGTFTLNTSQFQTQEHDVTGKQICQIGASDSIFQTESVV